MANSQTAEEFSKRLRKAILDCGLDPGSPTNLARVFNSRGAGLRVTPQAVRKWLSGDSIPTHDKLKALAGWLNVSPHGLHYGEADRAGHRAQERAASYRKPLPDQELVKQYRSLSLSQQQAVAEIITALAARDRRR